MNDKIRLLLDDMLDTMYAAPGVGLAAPQVGVLKRAIVIDIGEGPMKLVNPVIKNIQGESYMEEGCLSIPNYVGVVKRPSHITVEYLDENGQFKTLEATDFLARALCHEVDHLEGVLFKDLVIPEEEIPGEILEDMR